MNIDRFNKWLTILGNVGVLAGIIFVGIEIQQNTSMTQAQTRDTMTEKQMAFYELVLSDPLLTEAWASAFDPLWEAPVIGGSTPEFMRLTMLFTSNFRMWENEWYQFERGLFDSEEFQPRMEVWRGFMLLNSFQWAWKQQIRSVTAPKFVEQIDALIPQNTNQ